MDDQPPTLKQENPWKIVGIILIVLAVILAAATGYLWWVKNDQKSQTDSLKKQVSSLQKEVSTYQKNGSSGTTTNNGAGNSNTANQGEDLATTLLKVYEAAGYTVTGDAVTNIGQITNSSVSPWQTIQVTIGPKDPNAVGVTPAFFFRNGPSGAWRFGFARQDAPECDSFIGDQTKAFADQKCYDTIGNPPSNQLMTLKTFRAKHNISY